MLISVELNKLYFGMLLIVFPYFLFGQAKILKGTVYAKEDQSIIPNARMYLRGYENQGTYTEADGKYELIVPDAIITTGKVRLYIVPQGHSFPQSIDIPIDFKHEINIQVKSEAIERNTDLITSNDIPDGNNEGESTSQDEKKDGEDEKEEASESEEEELEVLEVAEEEDITEKKLDEKNDLENQIKKEINSIKATLEGKNLTPETLAALTSRLEKLEKQISENPELESYGTEIASLYDKIDKLKGTSVSFNQNNLFFISILGFIIFLLFILFFLYRKKRKKDKEEGS